MGQFTIPKERRKLRSQMKFRSYLLLCVLLAALLIAHICGGMPAEAGSRKLTALTRVDFSTRDGEQVVISFKGYPEYKDWKEGKKGIVEIKRCVSRIGHGEKKTKSKRGLHTIRWAQHTKDKVWVVLEFRNRPEFRVERSQGKIIVQVSPSSRKKGAKKRPLSPVQKGKIEATFIGQFGPLPPMVKRKMELYSWRKGCPVQPDELAYLRISHWGYDGRVHQGEMIVRKTVAREVFSIFAELFENRFPIEKMRLISEYEGDDNRSMADNNTSAFNCRFMTGSKNSFSKHSWGLAIDINPLVNPYVKGDKVLPPEGRRYLDRQKPIKGLIREGDVCHRAFTKRGWFWGGSWKKKKDYQHFEKR